MMSDEELASQVRPDDTQPFAELIDRYAGRVLVLCRVWVRHRDAAQDLAQEAFCRALDSLTRKQQQPERFGPWLIGIARNICLAWNNDRENSQVPFSSLGAEAQRDLDAQLEQPVEHDPWEDERTQLQAAIDELPDECSEVVRLYYAGDATYREIADLLDVSPATVNARLTRARLLLRERLHRNDEDLCFPIPG